MDLVTPILQAIGLFMATNIDDIIVVSLFFVRGAGMRGTTAKIAAGQYLGFGAILAVSVLVSLGAATFLPEDAIPYFGLIPLALGLYAAWKAWRGDDDVDEEKVAGKAISAWTVAGVTFANGGDNIGVYVPVFVTVGTAAIVAYSIVFLILVAVLVLLAKFVATRKPIAGVLKHWGLRQSAAGEERKRHDQPSSTRPTQVGQRLVGARARPGRTRTTPESGNPLTWRAGL